MKIEQWIANKEGLKVEHIVFLKIEGVRSNPYGCETCGAGMNEFQSIIHYTYLGENKTIFLYDEDAVTKFLNEMFPTET